MPTLIPLSDCCMLMNGLSASCSDITMASSLPAAKVATLQTRHFALCVAETMPCATNRIACCSMKNDSLHHDAVSLVDPHVETLLLINALPVLLKVICQNKNLDKSWYCTALSGS